MRWSGIALALGVALLVTTGAEAGQRKHKAKPTVKKAKAWTGAENALVGIKLYDTGLRVLDVYGTPDDIQALNLSSTSVGGGGGGATGPGGPGGMPGGGRDPRGGGRAPGGGGFPSGKGGGGSMAGAADIGDPFEFGDTLLQQRGAMQPGAGPQGPGGMGSPIPPGGMGGPPGGIPGAPGGMGGPPGGIPGAGGGASDRVTFTRWVYNREGSKYAFIIDKAGRVVQIEAIGIDNNRVKTKRGVGFGATFATVIQSYRQPDGYEIGGDNLMVKYLVHDNVAFRLSRLGTKKPQVVTGIVVAAGKS